MAGPLTRHLAVNDPLLELDVYNCPIKGCQKKVIGLSHWSRHLILEHPGQDGSIIDEMEELAGTPYNEMDGVDPHWRDHIARHLHVQIISGEWDASAVLSKLIKDPHLSPLLDARICRDCALAFEKGDTAKRDKNTNMLQLISRPRKRASLITFLVAEKLSALHGKRSEHRTSSKTNTGHLDLEIVSVPVGEHIKWVQKELELSGQPTLREFLEAEIAATNEVIAAEGSNLDGRRLRRRFGFESNGLNGQMNGIYLPYKLNRTGEGISSMNQWQSKDARQKSAEAAAQLLSLKTSREPAEFRSESSDLNSFSPKPLGFEMSDSGKRRGEDLDRLERPETRQRTSLTVQGHANSIPKFAGFPSGVWRSMDANSTPEPNGSNETRFPTSGNPPLASRLVDIPVNQALRQISQSLAPLQMIPAQIATLASQVASMQAVIESMNGEMAELKSQNRNLTRRMHNSRATEPYSPLLPIEREIPGPARTQNMETSPPGFPSCLSEVHEMSHEELDRLEDFYGRHFGDPTLRDDSDLLKRRFVFLQYIRA